MSGSGDMNVGGRVVLEIVSLAAGGRGVGRVAGGRAWFVEGAVAGDIVEAEAIRVHDRYVEGRVVRLERPSSHRRTAPCAVQKGCGGCPWMVLPEPVQRSAKLDIVREALVRIGGFVAPPMGEMKAAPEPFAYRNKVELSFGRDPAGRRLLGLHGAGEPGRIEDVSECLLLDASANRLLETVRRFFLEGPGVEDATPDRFPDIRVVLRRSSEKGESLVALRGPEGALPSGPALTNAILAEHPDVVGVVRIVSQHGRRSGTRTVVLGGAGFLEETLGGVRYRIPAATFFQVNPAAAEILVREVLDAAEGARHAVDLYGGVGAFGLPLARAGCHVTVIEADGEAVAAGRAAIGVNGLSRVRFVHAGAVQGLADVARRGRLPDLVVADPPRTGLGDGVAAGIARLSPRRVVLVGCDPATFARDAAALRKEGFRLGRVETVDLFPQTAHVEAVGVLERP